jgi:hypothetical protein
MKIEIDQSGKVEYTSSDTVVGDSLGNSLLLKGKDKRLIKAFYRSLDKPLIFALDTFAITVAYLIKLSFKSEHIYVIDVEYQGREAHIKDRLMTTLHKLNIPIQKYQIRFNHIGKSSLADKTAYKRFKLKTLGESITVVQIIKLLPNKKDRVFGE